MPESVVRGKFPMYVILELKGKVMDIWEKSLPDTSRTSGKVWDWISAYSV